MISNELRMWILGTGHKNAGFLPVVVLAKYAIDEEKPIEELNETLLAAEEPEPENESPAQPEEIIESEPIPESDISLIRRKMEEAIKESTPIAAPPLPAPPAPEPLPRPTPPLRMIDPDSERAADGVLLGEVVSKNESKTRVDVFTDRFRTTQRSAQRRIKLVRYAFAALLLLLLLGALFAGWRFFFGRGEQLLPAEPPAKITVPAIVVPTPEPEAPKPEAPKPAEAVVSIPPVPFIPEIPRTPPPFGPLISQIEAVPQLQPERPQPQIEQVPPPQVPQKEKPAAVPAPVRKPKPKPQPQTKITQVVAPLVPVPQPQPKPSPQPDREKLFALGVSLYNASDFGGARDAFNACLLASSPKLPNITVGDFALIRSAGNRRIPTPKPVLDDIAPLLRATKLNPSDRALYINLALANLRSSSPINTAELYNSILRHAEKNTK